MRDLKVAMTELFLIMLLLLSIVSFALSRWLFMSLAGLVLWGVHPIVRNGQRKQVSLDKNVFTQLFLQTCLGTIEAPNRRSGCTR